MKASEGETTGRRVRRRRFLRLTAGAMAAGGFGALSGSMYARYVEPGWLAVERVTIPVPGLPRAAEEIRLAFLSDLHVGPYVGADRVERAVAIARAFAPRLLLLGGDCMYWCTSYARPAVEAVARAFPPERTLSIMGNHEYWRGVPEIAARAFAEARVPLLRNEAREVLDGLWIAGLDCVGEGRADLDRALGRIPAGACAILLAHEPDFADEAAASGRIALQLSGHSHGGQVRLPFRGPLVLPPLGRRYVAGLYRVAGMPLYVSRGVGVVSPPVRFLCRPEVTLLTLRRAT